MNWDAISAVSEAIGAVAVVVTLIYLALQIRQNTKAVRGTTLDAITNKLRDELRWSSDIADVWRKVLESPDDMTFNDSWQLSEWMTAAFMARQNEWHQYQQGLVDREVWLSVQNAIRILMGIEWTKQWWQDYGRRNHIPSFVAEVDRIVAEGDRDVVGELGDLLNLNSQSGIAEE